MHATIPPSADHIAEAAEGMYASNLAASDAHSRVQNLVRDAARQLAREGDIHGIFRLLGSVPLHPAAMDAELLRLRSAAILHEHRRAARVRRRFAVALLGVLVYLFAVAPTVFVRLDNPYRIAHGMSELDWSEGFYWSVITLTTVGYGDIVPQTPYARMFGLFNAVLGVMTTGVIAGL